MQIDTHVYGSFDGYRTLGCSDGVTAGEQAELEEMGFGQPSNPDDLLLLKDRPCVLGRPLSSGRIAITRAFPGKKDDVGRPTILLATLVMSQDQFHAIRPGLRSLIRNEGIWNPSQFRSFSRIEVAGFPHPKERPPDHVWYLADMWIDVAGNQDQLLAFPDEPRSEEAILDLVSRLQPQDAVQVRWGIWLLSAGAPADVCTLAGFASGSIRRKVHQCQVSSSFRHEAAEFFFNSRGKSDGFLPARQILAAPPPAIHDRLEFSRVDGLPGMESTGVDRGRRRPWQIPLVISLAAMFIIAAGLGIVYLIPPSEPALLADSGASDGSSASGTGSESRSDSASGASEGAAGAASSTSSDELGRGEAAGGGDADAGDAGSGDSTSGDGEASDGGSGESPTPEAGGGSSAVQDQIEAQMEWGVFDAERWKEIEKTLGDNAGLESTNAKSISSAIVVAEKVAERLNGNDPFSPQRWEALKIVQEKDIRDLAIEGAFENFLRQVAAARNLEEWNKEIAPAVKSTFGSGDAAPLEAERRNLHSKIEDFVTEKSPYREYGFLTGSGGDSEFWDVGKKGLRGFTCLGWLVAVSPGDEAERQWEFHPLNKAAAVSPSELWFLWEPSNDDESLELRRLSSKFGPDVVDEIYPKDVDSSTRTLLENPEPSIETGDAQLLLVFRPLDWTEVEDVPQMQTLNPDPTQIDSPALETPRSEIPQQFADSAWKNLGPGKNPPGINSTLEKKVKGAVDSWNFAPMIKKPLTAEEKKNGTPPPPLLWEEIDLGDFENQANQSWGTKETTLKGKVEKGLDDPEGWPDLREELALFLKPFVSEGLFLVEPFDAEDADDDRRKKIFETFVEIVQNPESFFKQMQTGPDEYSIDDVLKRAKRWRDVITKRITTLKKWDDLPSRSESLLKDPKLDWLKRLQSRYQGMLTNLESQRKRLDKYIEASHPKRGPTSLEKEVDAQIEGVYKAFGMVALVLDGKNIEMKDLWPASSTLMPREFKGKKLIDALDQLEYSLKVVIDQLEVKKGSVDP